LNFTYLDVAKMIDHSLLNPTLTKADLEKGIAIALAYDVASVCIMPYALKWCAEKLAGSHVKASTTIGFGIFPHHRRSSPSNTTANALTLWRKHPNRAGSFCLIA
jgi:deoxyribose-phosphate aldolase